MFFFLLFMKDKYIISLFFVSLHLHISLRLNCTLTSWVEKDIVSDSEVIRCSNVPTNDYRQCIMNHKRRGYVRKGVSVCEYFIIRVYCGRDDLSIGI